MMHRSCSIRDPQPAAHGESGLDGPTLPEPTVQPINQHAVEFLHEIAVKHEKITIVALAPLNEHRGISEDLAGAEGKDRMYYAHGGKPQLGKYPPACRV